MSTGQNRPLRAFTLVELLMVIVGVALFAMLALPWFAQGRRKVSRISCVNNLKQAGLAFRIWSGDHGDLFPTQVSVTNGGTMELVPTGLVAPHFQVMSNELSTPRILVCSYDAERTNAYDFTSNLSETNISYFLGVDANESKPTMLLCGDRNLALDGVPLRPGLASLAASRGISWTKQIHKTFGNVAFAAGSVQQLKPAELRDAMARTGVATNRLVIP